MATHAVFYWNLPSKYGIWDGRTYVRTARRTTRIHRSLALAACCWERYSQPQTGFLGSKDTQNALVCYHFCQLDLFIYFPVNSCSYEVGNTTFRLLWVFRCGSGRMLWACYGFIAMPGCVSTGTLHVVLVLVFNTVRSLELSGNRSSCRCLHPAPSCAAVSMIHHSLCGCTLNLLSTFFCLQIFFQLFIPRPLPLLQGCIWRGSGGDPPRGSWPPESSAEPLWGSTLTPLRTHRFHFLAKPVYLCTTIRRLRLYRDRRDLI